MMSTNQNARPEPAPSSSIYGYCPICGDMGVTRERKIGGNDRCCNGHVYLSTDALIVPIALIEPKDLNHSVENLFRAISALLEVIKIQREQINLINIRLDRLEDSVRGDHK